MEVGDKNACKIFCFKSLYVLNSVCNRRYKVTGGEADPWRAPSVRNGYWIVNSRISSIFGRAFQLNSSSLLDLTPDPSCIGPSYIPHNHLKTNV